jgi:hypothetical protein
MWTSVKHGRSLPQTACAIPLAQNSDDTTLPTVSVAARANLLVKPAMCVSFWTDRAPRYDRAAVSLTLPHAQPLAISSAVLKFP